MSMRAAIVILALAGGCKDRSSAPAPASPPPRAVTRAPIAPQLRSAIEYRDEVPAAARERVATTVHAVESDQRTAFLEMVSSGGFTDGKLSLIAEQVEAELNGRTVAELVNLRGCAIASVCHWSAVPRDAKRVALVASIGGAELGAIDLVREDDGAWTVERAR
jgi:hypothetical protein